MKKFRLIFIATGGIAVPLLQRLAKDERFEVAQVITGLDKPAGRALELKASLVKQTAETLKIPVVQPVIIERTEPADFLLLMAYGQILPEEVLKSPTKGALNVHVSLLPRHRGASPVQNALLEGDLETGISLMKMIPKMDAGPVYGRFSIPIAVDDNAVTVSEKLAELAVQKVPEVLIQIAEGRMTALSQDETQATYCKKISKSDGEIRWTESADLIARRVRAYAGWPGTYARWNGKNLKVLEGNVVPDPGEPEKVFKKDSDVLVGTSQGSLKLLRVQLEGKKPMPIQEFLKGQPDFIGSKLG